MATQKGKEAETLSIYFIIKVSPLCNLRLSIGLYPAFFTEIIFFFHGFTCECEKEPKEGLE